MEFTLRCNNLKCRRELTAHAVVTTCSHVFCIDCSNQSRLSGQHDGHRPTCLACDAHLPNPDDVVIANLNPTEDYKTSVLSGLSPAVVMDCAGRAMAFWAYQSTQEIVYQEFLSKNLTEKYAALNTQIDKVIHDANSEVEDLRRKLSSMDIDQANLRRKYDEVVQAYRDKSRKHMQTQELYDKLKRRTMLGQVQNAASDAVENTIQASVAANRYVDRVGDSDYLPPPPPLFEENSNRMRHPDMVSEPHQDLRGRGNNGSGAWAEFSNQAGIEQNQPVQTPSSHRQRFAASNLSTQHINPVEKPMNISGTPHIGRRVTPARSPLRNAGHNTNAFAGYGMSAGLKVSNPASDMATGFSKPITRSRAQRPGPAMPLNSTAFSRLNPPANDIFSKGKGYY